MNFLTLLLCIVAAAVFPEFVNGQENILDCERDLLNGTCQRRCSRGQVLMRGYRCRKRRVAACCVPLPTTTTDPCGFPDCVPINGTSGGGVGALDPMGPDFDPFGGGTSGEGIGGCPPGCKPGITTTTTTTETPAGGDVDEKGLPIPNPVTDNTASEEAPLSDDLVSSGAEEDNIASAESATNNSPPPGFDGSDSKADDTPAEIKSLFDDVKTISENDALERDSIVRSDGLTADSIQKSDTPAENKNQDALMV
ncbi:unnamed protein product, partial [Owenia fusiformis]